MTVLDVHQHCDYCFVGPLKLSFNLRAVGFDPNGNVIVKTHCGQCEPPDDINDQAQHKLWELMQ